MNRRAFLRTSLIATAASIVPAAPGAAREPEPVNKSRAKIAAYYLRAQTYTCVPGQIREDMEWMADKGTNYVCVAVLEQDLFAARRNYALIVKEAARAGMQVLAVPARWGGLTAGAPKVPSLFSVLHPQTWVVGRDGSTAVAPKISGVISSVHHPATLAFFCDTLAQLYGQHPDLAGMILDEPKGFIFDQSPAAVAALGGRDAPMAAHYAAARDFYGKICAFSKERWPGKLTILFQEANFPATALAAGAAVPHLDYYGADGRPWGADDDARMAAYGDANGKILLDGRGEAFIRTARAEAGRKAFLLIENLNLPNDIIGAMDRGLPAALRLGADMVAYYYYPRDVEDPESAMAIVGRHLKAYTQG